MLQPLNGHLEGYLNDLDRIQSALDKTQRQISSTVRVGVASDDPGAVPDILRSQSAIAREQQVQANLNQVSAELASGDSALQQAAKFMDQAVTFAAQGANDTTDVTQYQTLLGQVHALRDAMVGVAATTVNGRFIFSGDRDSAPLYVLDASASNGVRLNAVAESTVSITDGAGVEVWHPRTAAEIFDAGSGQGPSVFAALGALATALEAQDPKASQDALAQLKTAAEHLNQQLGLYGIGETRVAAAISASSRAAVAEKQQLGTVRDTDVPAAAIELSQLGIQQQAALSVGARISQRNLFDFLA
jgi:flagellar hook-associated protein 3 FlgL